MHCSLSQIVRKMGSENTHGCTQNALMILEWYHKDGNVFLNHIVQVQVMKPGFHLWILKERAVKAVEARTFTKQAEKV
jgi:hypothetical protein